MFGTIKQWMQDFADRQNRRWFPELFYYESAAERKKLWELCYQRCLKRTRRRRWIARLCCVLIIVVTVVLALELIKRWFGNFPPRFLMTLLPQLVASVAATLIVFRFMRNDFQLEIRRELNSRGFAVCLHCGYDLRTQTESRCPECGHTDAASMTP